MKVLHLNIFIFLPVFTFYLLAQTKIDEKKINQLFWEQNYQEILPDLQALYNQDRKNLEYNFKLGTALLFEADSSYKLDKAIGHLTFASSNSLATAEYHYYLGRALHNKEDFDNALIQFELYKTKKSKNTLELPVEEYIRYCRNGKNLEKITNSKFEKLSSVKSDISQFGKSYKLEKIEKPDQFNTNIDVQTKIDKKKNHTPLIYYNEGINMRFFASYGDKENSQKDIYSRVGSGEDKKIIKLSNEINTDFDEDFPLFDEKTGHLYFSSKGHNSIGGYDIFRAEYDSATNNFKNVENLGVGVSTPFDDFLFITNPEKKLAYLSSNKLSRSGEFSIFYGDFSFFEKIKNKKQVVLAQFKHEINTNVNLSKIIIYDSNNESIGTYIPDQDGKIKMEIPSGKMKLQFDILGSNNNFEAVIDIPESEQIINQEILFSIENNDQEKLTIVDLNEKQNLEIIASNIVKKLEENNADLQANNQEKNEENIDKIKEKQALVNLDMDGFNYNEVVDKISDRIIEIELTQKENEELLNKLNSVIVDNRNYYDELQNEIDSIEKNMNNLSSIEKIEQLITVKNLKNEQEEVKSQTIWLQALNDSLFQLISENNPNKRKYEEIVQLGNEITNLTQENKYNEAYLQIISKHDIIPPFSTITADEKIYNELVENQLEQVRIEKKITSLSSEISLLSDQRKNVEIDLRNSSKKDFEKLEIELNNLDQKIISNQKQINRLKKDLEEVKLSTEDLELKRNIVTSIIKEDIENNVTYNEAKLKYFDNNSNEKEINKYEKEIEALKAELNSEEKKLIQIKEEYQIKLNNIEVDETSNNEQILVEIEHRNELNKLKEELSSNNSSNNNNNIILENYLNEKIQELDVKILNLQQRSDSNLANLDEVQNEFKNVNTNLTNNTDEQNSSNSNLKKQSTNNETENQTEKQNEMEQSNLANNTEEQNSSNSNLKKQSTNNETENQTEKQNEMEQSNLANNTEEQNSSNSNLNNQSTNNETENQTKKQNEENQSNLTNNTDEQNSSNSNLNNQSNNNETENQTEKQNEEERSILANNTEEQNSSNSNLNNQSNNNETENQTEKQNEEDQSNLANNTDEQNSSNSNLKMQSTNNETENENNIQNNTRNKKVEEYKMDELPVSNQSLSELTKNELENQISVLSSEKETLINELTKTYPTLSYQTENQLTYELNKLENEQLKNQKEIEELKNLLTTEKNKKSKSEIQSKIEKKEQINDSIETKKVKTKIELAKISNPSITLNKLEKTEEINENQKNEVLSSEAYKNYVIAMVDFEKEQDQYFELTNKLTETQEKLNFEINQATLKSNNKNFSVEIESLVKQIESIKKQRNESYQKLQDKKNTIEKIENENPKVKSEIQLLASKRIEPIRKSVVNNDPIITSGGFEIKSITNSSNLNNQPIPINVKSPSGLVYRVQVGAFRKPLQQNVYSGFTPVSGELQSNGLTVYLAGYFNSSTRAIDARKQIQQLGYSDAFVVAYCNGKKLTLGEARQLEARGECKPIGDNEFLAEISRNTQVALKEQNIDYTSQPTNTSTNSVELKNLFFTVQIGVYNKPINENQKFPGLTEISSNISPSKQIRYSTGKFSDIETAKTRKNLAVSSGISDAFIVAYYQGERITIVKANELIAQYGNSILENENNFANSNRTEDTVIKLESYEKPFFSNKKEEPEIRIIKYQIHEEFQDFPKEKIDYFNNYGLFQYNSNNKKIESIEFSDKKDLDDIIKYSGFVTRLEVDSKKEEKSPYFMLSDNQFDGDLVDFFLRTNCIQSIETKKEISVILNSGILTEQNYTNLLKDTFELKVETYEPK